MAENIFQFVKDNILLSDFVEKTGLSKGLTETGPGEYRTNNIISQGENTNAMRIKDDEGYFNVFSHGQESGDIIELYRYVFHAEDENRAESAMNLANYMGIAVPDSLKRGHYTSSTNLYEVMDKISIEAHKYLLHSSSRDAATIREYLADRGATQDIIKKWRLGAFPENKNEALEMIKKCGSIEDLHDVGMIKYKDNPQVSMRGRLTSPIFNTKGSVIAFSSRAVDGVHHYTEAKYINSPATRIFDKSKTLYGQHLLDSEVEKVVICEGNFDVIALNEILDSSDTIAVATCGTALTAEHAHVLKQNGVKDVCIFFDSDTAGKEASIKSIFMVNHFRSVSISSVRSGKDPWDSFVSGEDIRRHIHFQPSAILDAVTIAYDLYGDGDKMNRWIKQTYGSLRLFKYCEQLLDCCENKIGIRKNTLNNIISGIKTSHRETRSAKGISLGDEVSLSLRALLSFRQEDLRFIAAPVAFCAKKSSYQHVLELLGAMNEEEDEALLCLLVPHGDYPDGLENLVHALDVDDQEYDDIRNVFLQTTAKKILWEWSKGKIPPGGEAYIKALVVLSNGYVPQDAREAFVFIFDVMALSVLGK